MGEPAGGLLAFRPAASTVVLLVGLFFLASCANVPMAAGTTGSSAAAASAAAPPSATGTATSVGASGTGATTPPVPASDLGAIAAALDAINATAGGPVTGQRVVLQRWVVPAEAGAQRDCPAAHNTLRLDAVYDDLRRSPEGPSTQASTRLAAASTDYLLPVLITIFTGDRITGTDLTTLRLFVTQGTARVGHLCVS